MQMKNKIQMFFENFETIIQFQNSKMLQEYSDQFNLNPMEDLTKMENILLQIKTENENVTVENFQELYNLIHKTNLEIRYFIFN